MKLGRWPVLLALMAVVLCADQVTKFLAVGHLTRVYERHGARTLGERVEVFLSRENLERMRKKPVVVVRDRWQFKYVENPGAAWGMLGGTPEHLRVPFFYVVSLVAIGFIVVFVRRLSETQRTLRVAMGLVLGGALGNFTDRVLRGYVIDFIDWHWGRDASLHWPTFNVADVGISLGVALMLAETLLSRHAPRERAVVAGPVPETARPEAQLPAAATWLAPDPAAPEPADREEPAGAVPVSPAAPPDPDTA